MEHKGTIVISEAHTDDNGIRHTNVVTRELNGVLHYYHNDKELWVCPYLRWFAGLPCSYCQIKFDLADDVPVDKWLIYTKERLYFSTNPKLGQSQCVCPTCPNNWDECEIAVQLLKEKENGSSNNTI